MALAAICKTILDETSSDTAVRAALDNFTQLCSEIGGVVPDRSFDAWAEDSFLEDGVAINPRAAAHCVTDYRRSVVFIRAVYAAIHRARERFPDTRIAILYAGCGPYATLLLPLLGKFMPPQLEITLLDIHQHSIDSVERLLSHFDLGSHGINTVRGDACRYQHTAKLHLIIAETMQKSLEQEPQFAVTANLAPQLQPEGIFIPQKIEVDLCLAHFQRADEYVPLARVLTLVPDQAAADLNPVSVEIPSLPDLAEFEAALSTRIQVFDQYWLREYEAEITLPSRCPGLAPLSAGQVYRVCYQLGKYPRFNVELQ